MKLLFFLKSKESVNVPEGPGLWAGNLLQIYSLMPGLNTFTNDLISLIHGFNPGMKGLKE